MPKSLSPRASDTKIIQGLPGLADEVFKLEAKVDALEKRIIRLEQASQ